MMKETIKPDDKGCYPLICGTVLGFFTVAAFLLLAMVVSHIFQTFQQMAQDNRLVTFIVFWGVFSCAWMIVLWKDELDKRKD